MTNTTAAKFLTEKWAKEAEMAREANLVMAGLVKRYDVLVKSDGTKINIPFVSNLTTTAVADNTAVTFQAPTEAEIELNLDQMFESSFAIQDKTSAQSGYELGTMYSHKSGEALARKIDSTLTALYAGLSQTVADGTAEITAANIVRAILYLDNANVPQTGRAFVVRPSTMYSMRQITAFTQWNATGEKGVTVGGKDGFVGNVYGIPVYQSTNIVTTANVAKNLLFHRDAFALAIQKDVTLERDRRPDYLATGFISSALWGVVELRDDHGVLINSKDNIT